MNDIELSNYIQNNIRKIYILYKDIFQHKHTNINSKYEGIIIIDYNNQKNISLNIIRNFDNISTTQKISIINTCY